MAKLYSKKTLANKQLIPKKETVSLILQYSSSLNIIKIGKLTFECISN